DARPRKRLLARDIEVDVILGELATRTIYPFWNRQAAPRPVLQSSTDEQPTGINSPRFPRKEVIQPQLPLRLPCYDFTPVTNPTFGGCLPCGLAHRLRVLPASVV